MRLAHNPIEAQCMGKQAFPSRAIAAQIARKGSRAKDIPVGAYKCSFCNAYHVGQSTIRPHGMSGIKILEKHA